MRHYVAYASTFCKVSFSEICIIEVNNNCKERTSPQIFIKFPGIAQNKLRFRKCQDYVIRTGRYERNFVTENKNHYLHLYGTSFLLCNNFHDILTFFSDAL